MESLIVWFSFDCFLVGLKCLFCLILFEPNMSKSVVGFSQVSVQLKCLLILFDCKFKLSAPSIDIAELAVGVRHFRHQLDRFLRVSFCSLKLPLRIIDHPQAQVGYSVRVSYGWYCQGVLISICSLVEHILKTINCAHLAESCAMCWVKF